MGIQTSNKCTRKFSLLSKSDIGNWLLLIIIYCSCTNGYALELSPSSFIGSHHSQFGSAVLLDCTWDVDKLVGCSKIFCPLLHQLTIAEDNTDVLDACQHQISSEFTNKQCLKSLVYHLGDQTVVKHLYSFLHTYPLRRHIIPFWYASPHTHQ